MTSSYVDPRIFRKISVITRKKISQSLIGKKHSTETKIQMSKSKSGSNNFYFGKSLNSVTLLAAQQVRGKKIYVYYEKDKSLVNNLPFVSIRETVKNLPISPVTLGKKLDSDVAHKGYYYYSSPQKR